MNLLDQIIAKYPMLAQMQQGFNPRQPAAAPAAPAQPGAGAELGVTPGPSLPQTPGIVQVAAAPPGFSFPQVTPRKQQQSGQMDAGMLAQLSKMFGMGG